MPPSTRYGKQKDKTSTLAPSDSASQAAFTRQRRSTTSSRESLVKSENLDSWHVAKPFLLSNNHALEDLDQTEIDTFKYTPQSWARTLTCRRIPDLDARRKKIRKLGYRLYGWPRPSTRHRMYPSDKVYNSFKTEFTELDACVVFSPMHTLKEVDDDGNKKAIGVNTSIRCLSQLTTTQISLSFARTYCET